MQDKSETLGKRLLKFLERDRFSLSSAVIYVFIIASIRSVLEGYVSDDPFYSITIFTNHILISYPEILMGGFFIYLVTKINVRKIINVILLGYPILILPPIIDYYILGQSSSKIYDLYSYQEMNMISTKSLNILWNPLSITQYTSVGLTVMFVFMAFGSAAYVALKNDLFTKFISLFKGKKNIKGFFFSVGNTILSYISIILVVGFIGALQLIIKTTKSGVVILNNFTFPIKTKYYSFFYNSGYTESEIFTGMGVARSLAVLQRSLLLSAFFVILAIVFGSLCVYVKYKKPLLIMLKNLRLLRTIPITICSFLGITSVHMIDPYFTDGLALDPMHVLHWPYIFFCVLTVFLLAQISLLLDDFFRYRREERGDDPLTKGLIPRYHYRQLITALILSILYFSFILGWLTLIISLLWIGISVLTSYVGWQKFIPGYFRFGFFGLLSFLMGFYTPGSWHSKIVRYSQEGEIVQNIGVTVSRIPPINSHIIIISAWLILIMSIFYLFGYMPKKKIDNRSDIYNVLNRNTVVNLGTMSTFTFLMFPIYFFHSTIDLILFISISAGATLWFKILEREEIIYIGLITVLLIFSIRFL